jgi:predicted trehalose synthase
MHAGFLASNRESFRPVAVSDQELQSWAETPLRDVEAALSVLRKRHKSRPDGALAVLIQKLEGDEGGLRQAAGVLHERGQGLMKAQIHGDLYTGQGLIAAGLGNHVIDRFLKEIGGGNADAIQSVAQELSGRVRWIDFEGVPAKTPVDDAEDGRDSPFLDLAGIAQGFCYIVNTRLYIQLGLPKPEDWAMTSGEDREKARRISLALAGEMTPEEAAVSGLTAELINLLNNWLAEVTSAFLDGYLDGAEARGLGKSLFAPWNRDRIKALVYFWILIRAAHELRYETYGRDWGWEAIPGGRILQILRLQDLASAL